MRATATTRYVVANLRSVPYTWNTTSGTEHTGFLGQPIVRHAAAEVLREIAFSAMQHPLMVREDKGYAIVDPTFNVRTRAADPPLSNGATLETVHLPPGAIIAFTMPQAVVSADPTHEVFLSAKLPVLDPMDQALPPDRVAPPDPPPQRAITRAGPAAPPPTPWGHHARTSQTPLLRGVFPRSRARLDPSLVAPPVRGKSFAMRNYRCPPPSVGGGSPRRTPHERRQQGPPDQYGRHDRSAPPVAQSVQRMDLPQTTTTRRRAPALSTKGSEVDRSAILKRRRKGSTQSSLSVQVEDARSSRLGATAVHDVPLTEMDVLPVVVAFALRKLSAHTDHGLDGRRFERGPG
jgi:hypothetical protein